MNLFQCVLGIGVDICRKRRRLGPLRNSRRFISAPSSGSIRLMAGMTLRKRIDVGDGSCAPQQTRSALPREAAVAPRISRPAAPAHRPERVARTAAKRPASAEGRALRVRPKCEPDGPGRSAPHGCNAPGRSLRRPHPQRRKARRPPGLIQASKFALVINLQTARSLRMAVPAGRRGDRIATLFAAVPNDAIGT